MQQSGSEDELGQSGSGDERGSVVLLLMGQHACV
jgi:hypothetical protein